MDFMDDDMKQIAISKFYGTEGSVYAACEAVLAEQKRREAPKPQMTAAGRDAFTRARQEFDDGETVPAPADDVVQRMIDAYLGCKERSITAGTTWLRPSMAAALAVAREGMVPATLIGELKDACDRDWTTETAPQVITITANAMRWRNDKIKDLEQQLAAMYSLEQVEKAIREAHEMGVPTKSLDLVLAHVLLRLPSPKQEPAPTKEEMLPVWESATAKAIIAERDEQWEQAVFAEIADGRLINRVRARLTTQQQPTEQEPAKWVNISYRVDVMGSTCVVCGAVISDQLAHTEWHNNFMNFVDALGKGGK